MQELKSRVAVVTGAASGIGRAMCERFAAEGMKLVLADIEAGALDEATEAIAKSVPGTEAMGVVADVTDQDSVHALAEKTIERFGGVHVLCNNAGVITGGAAWEAPLSDYDWVMGVNVYGVVHGVRAFVPLMLEAGDEGHIVNTSSMAGMTSMPYTSIYNMSKHAVVTYSESLYHELNLRGAPIGVSVLCPEAIATQIHRSDRNRPDALVRDGAAPTESELVIGALSAATRDGIPPSVMAERVVNGIRENRFYLLAEDGWLDACKTRLEDIRLGRNPTFAPPVG